MTPNCKLSSVLTPSLKSEYLQIRMTLTSYSLSDMSESTDLKSLACDLSVGYCSFTCQRNDWREHKKVCLNKQNVYPPCGVGSGLTKSNEHKVFESKIGKIVEMIASSHEEYRSQNLHMHCQVCECTNNKLMCWDCDPMEMMSHLKMVGVATKKSKIKRYP